jgi:opacity protein-like surface antigen
MSSRQSRTRRTKTRLAAVSATLVLASVASGRAAVAADAHRFTLSVSGSFAPTTLTFDGDRRFTEFAEEGTLSAHYSGGRGAGGDAALRFAWGRHWGVSATFAALNRGSLTSYTARFPHPLYLNRHREVSDELDRLSYYETDAHVAMVYLGHAGPLDFTLFAGPSLFHVNSDLLQVPQYSQAYPFDTVTLTVVSVLPATSTAFGFNVGAGLERRLNDSLGIIGQVRYGRGQGKLKLRDQDPVTVDAGGLQLVAGLRIGL